MIQYENNSSLETPTSMATRSKQTTLPSSLTWITIQNTDGDISRWPKNTIHEPDNDGYVNSMRPVSIEDGVAIRWRIVIGEALAQMLRYPITSTYYCLLNIHAVSLSEHTEENAWVLKEWPNCYRLYDHVKGPFNGDVDHNLYLIGELTIPILDATVIRPTSDRRFYQRCQISLTSGIYSSRLLAHHQP